MKTGFITGFTGNKRTLDKMKLLHSYTGCTTLVSNSGQRTLSVYEIEVTKGDDGSLMMVSPNPADDYGPTMLPLRPCDLCWEADVEKILADRDWAEQGVCYGSEHDGFFPNNHTLHTERREALSMCAVCPVREECLAYGRALHQALGGVPGVWGGETWTERVKILNASGR